MRILFLDTETTGIPLWHDPSDDPRQPHVVELAMEFWDGGNLAEQYCQIINPGVPISDDVAQIHGITTEIAIEKGITPSAAHEDFMRVVGQADLIVGHNISFDIRLMRIQAARVTGEKWDNLKPTFCTMRRSTNIVKALKPNWRTPTDYKWPNLTETVRHFFDEDHGNAHSAAADCAAARRIYFHLQGMAQAA